MVCLKPCARPTFFIILLSKNVTTSPPYCVFFLTHIFLQIIKFLFFYCFVSQEDYNISPILGFFQPTFITYVHGFKTMCKPCAHGFKTMHMVYGFKTTWFMVLKPCARPTFFIILLSKNITTSPPYCVFFLTHIFLRIIKFLFFYCFVSQEDYNISPILGFFLADIYYVCAWF